MRLMISQALRQKPFDMTDKKALEAFIENKLADTPYFLVSVSVSPDNEIKVEIDSFESVDIDFCISLSKQIEEAFPRDAEDYALEVGSAGITSPFKVLRQYEKNIGRRIEVLARDGRKYTGTLLGADAEGFRILVTVKEKPEGAKRPVEVEKELTFTYGDINSASCLIEF